MSRQTFDLTILGSSSATPTATRNPTSQLLNIAERFFLIDCGEATQIQLRRFKCKFQKIDHIFISHLHGDHFLGLPGLLASMHLLGRKQELCIYAPAALEEIISLINSQSDTMLNYPIRFIHTDDKGLNKLYEDQKVEVFSFPLKHRIKTTGFLFREKPAMRNIDKFKLEKHHVSLAEIHKLKMGEDAIADDGRIIPNAELTTDPLPPRSYAYCSDTLFHEEMADFIQHVDLLYHESTFLEDKKDRAKVTFHSTAMQAATMARLAHAKQLVLGHFSARYGELDDFLTEASGIFPQVELATEGKKISL
ncbi:MAG: ribonuclease Z [Bacteroidetes bacterium]|nr:ribonuclease Z [Bacteroidota bacterium]